MDRRRRVALGGGIIIWAGCTALFSVLFITGKTRFTIDGWDEQHYYCYARSLVIDGDLDFSNEYAHLYWNPSAGDTPTAVVHSSVTGHVPNRYPAGMGLLLAPTLLFAHGATWLANAVCGWDLPYDGWSPWYVYLYALGNVTIAWAGVFFAWKTARRLADFRSSALAVPAVLLGSNLFYYVTLDPDMCHAMSVGLSGLYFWGLIASERRQTWGTALALGALNGVMAMVRYTDILIGVAYAASELAFLARGGGSRRVNAIRPRLWRWMAYGLGVLIGFAPQMVVWKRMYGEFLVNSYEGYGFDWLNPALVQTLFSTRNSLLVWTPLIALSAVGLVLGARRGHGRLAATFIFVWFVQWYVNSAWRYWWFGASFGARAMLVCWPVWAIGYAWLIQAVLDTEDIRQRKRRMLALTGSSGICIAWTSLLMVLFHLGLISHEQGFTLDSIARGIGSLCSS